MAEHHLHDVDLEVTAELTDLEADKLSVSVRLTVWCRGLNNECGWFFDVPDSIDNAGIAQVALHLTPAQQVRRVSPAVLAGRVGRAGQPRLRLLDAGTRALARGGAVKDKTPAHERQNWEQQ